MGQNFFQITGGRLNYYIVTRTVFSEKYRCHYSQHLRISFTVLCCYFQALRMRPCRNVQTLLKFILSLYTRVGHVINVSYLFSDASWKIKNAVRR